MSSDDADESIVQAGEILIARSNTPELVGRVARFNNEVPGAVASDLTIRIWPGSEINGEFLAQYLSALYLSGNWRERAGGEICDRRLPLEGLRPLLRGLFPRVVVGFVPHARFTRMLRHFKQQNEFSNLIVTRAAERWRLCS